jgi:hypothetical protein
MLCLVLSAVMRVRCGHADSVTGCLVRLVGGGLDVTDADGHRLEIALHESAAHKPQAVSAGRTHHGTGAWGLCGTSSRHAVRAYYETICGEKLSARDLSNSMCLK